MDEPSGSWSGLTSQIVSVVQFGAATSSPKYGHELFEAESPVPTCLLGDREVEEVEDVRVDVDEEALEPSRPAVDDAAREPAGSDFTCASGTSSIPSSSIVRRSKSVELPFANKRT